MLVVQVDVDKVDLSLHQIWVLMLLVGEERDVDLQQYLDVGRRPSYTLQRLIDRLCE